MGKTWLILRWCCSGVLGILLLIWARKLSVRYNAWTTSFREHHPEVNPPPTPEWRRRNTTIVTWLLRILGAWLALLAALALLGLMNAK
jgi:hypothetical protein